MLDHRKRHKDIPYGLPGIVYHVVRCPVCHSDRTHIVSTERPLRRHKCQSCGQPFKSIEDTYTPSS